ncbi:MAG: glycosyl hydrolase family 18 protein [Chloroflexi bacterium]|nr:glycosyl hydrolase family 18 protein [Chloroflexota bacterium]
MIQLLPQFHRTRTRQIAARLILVAVSLAFVMSLIPYGALPAGKAEAAPAMLRWGYAVTYDPTSEASLKANINKLDIVAPYFYHVSSEGTVSGDSDNSMIDIARSHGVKIVPMIANTARYDDLHALLSNKTKVDSVINQLADLVVSKGYDGIHIDFEAVNSGDRGLLTQFMAKLHARFQPMGKLVTMAIAAKTHDATSGWAGGYDYADLSQYLDYGVIMAYDYTSSGSSQPGPVAPIDWVRSVASFAVSQMGANKVILGIPFYGYDWNKAKGPPAKSMKYSDTMAVAQQYNGAIRYDAALQSATMTYVKDGEQHEVWFENQDSFNAKLQVAKDMGLAGFGTWRLGHEDSSVWEFVSDTINPATPIQPFTSTSTRLYFPETGHSLSSGFLYYWRNNGGLSMFGYPRTEEFTEGGYTVQYFERARFEYHPEFQGTPYEVELGLLGNQAVQGRSFDKSVPFTSTADRRYFAETGHSLSYGFKYYWDNNGGLAVFGYPISEEISEVNPEDTETYTVQYFERARFEYHPEFKGTPYEVELGLLGNQTVRDKGWIN